MRYRNFILFIVLAAVWGSAFMAIKAGLEFFPPVLFAAIRYDVAGVIMLAYAAFVADRWRPQTREEWTLVTISGILMIAAYHAFLFVGEQETTSAAAAVIVSLSPILTTGFARALLPSERLTMTSIVGLLLGLVGVAILANPEPGNLFAGHFVGKILVFMATASFALGSVWIRRIDAELPIETMEAWAMLIGAAAMHLISPLRGEAFAAIIWTPEALWALGYLSLASSALGFLIYFDLLERLGPVEINLVSYVAPIFAALSGWVILSEVVDPATVAGFLVIVTGFVLLKREALAQEIPKLQAAFVGDRSK